MKQALFIVLLFTAGVLFSQPALQATVNKNTVEVNEIFTYKVSSNTDCSVTPPDFGELEIVEGPVTGQSTTIINGVQSNEYSLTYYLRANKKGTFSVGPATMKCKLKKISSEKTINIKVVAETSTVAATEKKQGHFLKLTANKTSVYVGEPFVISFKFYSPDQPTSISAIQPGTASGLWRGDLDPNRASYTMTQEVIKGEHYFVLEMLREVCIPLRPGKITIDPYYGALVYQGSDFFSNGTQLDGKTNSLTIDVKKIPVNVPENFNGLVGRFDLKHSIDKTTLKEGQAMTLNLSISGTGNLNAFDAPKLTLPEGFTQNEAIPTEKTTITEEGLSGTIDYEFVITVGKPGNYELAPFSFSYFDLGSKSVRQLSTEKFSVQVEEGNYDDHFNPDREKPTPTDTDIHFIQDQEGISFRLDEFFFGSSLYLLALGGPLLLVIVIAIVKRRRSSMSEESKTESRQKSARKAALRSLDQASSALKKGEQKEALKLLQNAMFSFFMTKLNLSLSGLSQRAITTELENRKIDTALMLEFTHTWRQVELAQYAPVTPENLQSEINSTRKLINSLDEKL